MKKAFILSIMVITLLAVQYIQASESLDSILKPCLSKYELPAIAAAVVKKGEIVSAGAVGTRRIGTNTPVTINDKFHLGSDTKAMTSLLAAMLVEKGKLRWDTKIGEIFPEAADKMNKDFRNVTLTQSLSHTSGIAADNDDFGRILTASYEWEGNLDEMRYLFVLERGKLPLDRAAGGTFEYSNTNFVIVGAMIERIEGKTWDELITEKIFNPLELKSAGLGMQGSLGKIDAPLAHTSENGKIKAILPGPNSDNLAIIGPAGIAHMSVLDFARWAGWNAGEGKHKPYLVKPETMKKLHTPVISMPEKKDAAPGTPSSGKYAFGWGELSVAWAPHPLVYHGGSNGKNLAHIWLDVKEDAAIVVMSNISGQKTNEAFFSLAKELYTKYIKKP